MIVEPICVVERCFNCGVVLSNHACVRVCWNCGSRSRQPLVSWSEVVLPKGEAKKIDSRYMI